MTRGREIAIAAAGLAALALGAFFVSPGRPAPAARAFRGSSFDAGPHGAKAVYLLLEALGHRVERRTRPAAARADERVRVVLGAAGALDPAVLAWVARGNTLVVAPPPPGMAPGARRHEDGRIVALPSAAALENAALRRDPAPALELAAVCAAWTYGGRVVFDETPRGGGTRALLGALARFPLGLVLLQALAGLALFAWARGVRFGPALAAAGDPPAPAAVEQVAAMADLFERAHATAAAAATLAQHFRQRATRALGLPPAVADAALAERFCRRHGGAPARLAALLAAARGPLGPRDLARLAQGLHEFEERMHGTRR